MAQCPRAAALGIQGRTWFLASVGSGESVLEWGGCVGGAGGAGRWHRAATLEALPMLNGGLGGSGAAAVGDLEVNLAIHPWIQ
jgi:hypothetical protein